MGTVKRTPLVDPDFIIIDNEFFVNTRVIVVDRPPSAAWTTEPLGTIAIRRSTGYVTHLIGVGESVAWYALPAWKVERVAVHLHDHHPNLYRQINWEGKGL